VAAIAQVEPLTSTRALSGPFDYAIPEDLRASVRVGSLLRVPFGRQELLGVVVGLSDRSELDSERLRAPRAAVGAGVPADLVELADWIARAYCSTRARALTLVLPPGAGGGVGEQRRLVATLTAAGEGAIAGAQRVTPKQRELLERLARAGASSASALAVDHAALRRLEARGLIELVARAQRRAPEHTVVGVRGGTPELNPEQIAAVDALLEAMQTGGSRLLFGVTGSGKTEVYLQAAADALQRGRGVIVLVPEIGLTPQTVTRFVDRFGDTVALLHSGLSAGERHDEWLRLRRGEARICVGPPLRGLRADHGPRADRDRRGARCLL